MILNLGDEIAAFTWLGRLQNLSLEGLLSVRGISAKALSFCIHLHSRQPADCLKLWQDLKLGRFPENPLRALPVEKVVDLGPYFDQLNAKQQSKARGDWFQPETLRDFASGLQRIRLVERGSVLGMDLASLAVI